MAISETQLGSIETSVSALLATGVPLVPELRRQFPQFTFVRCAMGDMDARPYHTGKGYQLYLKETLNKSHMAAHQFCGMGCKAREAANGRSPSQRVQRRRPPAKLVPARVVAKSRARSVTLLGIVVPLRPSSRFLRSSRFCYNAAHGGLIQCFPNRQNICINLTDSPEQADGVVVAI